MNKMNSKSKASIIGDMVFGANDGIVTTFAVVAGVAGAALDARIVLIMGLANLVGDGVSMAVGDYLGRKSEQEIEAVDHVQRSFDPRINAVAIFVAFLIAGFVPLIPYVFGVARHDFLISTLCAGIAMFAVGSLRSLVTKRHWFSAGLEVLLVGSIAAGSAFLVGYILKNVVS